MIIIVIRLQLPSSPLFFVSASVCDADDRSLTVRSLTLPLTYSRARACVYAFFRPVKLRVHRLRQGVHVPTSERMRECPHLTVCTACGRASTTSPAGPSCPRRPAPTRHVALLHAHAHAHARAHPALDHETRRPPSPTHPRTHVHARAQPALVCRRPSSSLGLTHARTQALTHDGRAPSHCKLSCAHACAHIRAHVCRLVCRQLLFLETITCFAHAHGFRWIVRDGVQACV